MKNALVLIIIVTTLGGCSKNKELPVSELDRLVICERYKEVGKTMPGCPKIEEQPISDFERMVVCEKYRKAGKPMEGCFNPDEVKAPPSVSNAKPLPPGCATVECRGIKGHINKGDLILQQGARKKDELPDFNNRKTGAASLE